MALIGQNEAVPDAGLGEVALRAPGLLPVLVDGDQGALGAARALGVALNENGALAVGAHELMARRAGHIVRGAAIERDQGHRVGCSLARQRRVVPEADLVALPRPRRGLIR